MSGHTLQPAAFTADYLAEVRLQIRKCRYFTTNNLNRDFVGTRGFSVVFRREQLERVQLEFPWSALFLQQALRPDCNAFDFNPLQLSRGSHVSPHIDRSLRSYVLDIDPPRQVSVLYVEVPAGLRGGELELRRKKRFLGRVVPQEGLLVQFDGDLEHSVARVDSEGLRLSVICEQYALDGEQLELVPAFRIETRAKTY